MVRSPQRRALWRVVASFKEVFAELPGRARNYIEQSGVVMRISRQRSGINIGLKRTRKYYVVESWVQGILGVITTT